MFEKYLRYEISKTKWVVLLKNKCCSFCNTLKVFFTIFFNPNKSSILVIKYVSVITYMTCQFPCFYSGKVHARTRAYNHDCLTI